VRIVLDTERCTGHGRCYDVGAPFYESDDDGYCRPPPDTPVPADLEDAARRGARNCPERALTVLDD
jgi:ferredoxin